MPMSLDENAFDPAVGPEALWRASCCVTGYGHTDQAEWLHEMAVQLIELRELAVVEVAVVSTRHVAYTPEGLRQQLLKQP